MRQITWVLLVDRGAKENPTFRFDAIQRGLDYLAEYWALQFTRTSSSKARIKFIASKSAGGPGWVMWANRSRFEIRISPTFNFGSNLLTCASAVVHEFMHLAGGTQHSPNAADVMYHALQPGKQITPRDGGYMSAYQWKGARRPWTEPNYFREKFAEPARMGVSAVGDPMNFGCDVQRTWQEWWNGFGARVAS